MRLLIRAACVLLLLDPLVHAGAAWTQPCPPETVECVSVHDASSRPDAPYRWRDVATNPYALSYQDSYTYDDATVTVSFEPCGQATLTGHLSATDLKPNFAYQMKLAGKPTSIWGAEGDDQTNERLGYAGRWWRVQPNPGNATDQDYEANHNTPGYIFEGYLIFDHVTTDRFGAAEQDFAIDSSYHVLWWDGQRPQGSCDSPTAWSTVIGEAGDPAYDENVGPTEIGVYAEIERHCHGTTTLPEGMYDCRFMMTEESFHQSGPPNPGWVSVNGDRFWKEGGPFHYAGTNCYYLMVYAADTGLRAHVDEVLTEAKAMGLTVVRTWAFNDGADEWNALQTAPGVYDETIFQGLDYVLSKARELGLHLILPLVNNWNDYGGMNQYVEWSATATSHDHFYTDASCRQWFKDHVTTVLNRVNTVNGKTYRNDATILAWELGNEPRCESDPSGNTLQTWIEEMAGHVKSVDSQHLLTTGSEGFYGPTGPAHNPLGWFGTRGVDFIRNHQPASVDFACFHAWPDHWGISYNQSMAWATDHADDSTALLGKPVIFEEFGKQRPLGTRDVYYQGWFDTMYGSAAAGGAAGGSNFWILYHDDYPDYDGFGVYYPGDASTVGIIETEAARMRALCDPYAAQGTWAAAVVCDTVRFELGEMPGAGCAIIDLVDVGNPDSEAGHNLAGWGPIEPLTHGGNFGGVADCRAVYASAGNGDGESWATVDLDFGEGELTPKYLTIQHLEGIAQDAFEVYLYPPGAPDYAVKVYAYPGDGRTTELWYKKTITVAAAGIRTLEFVSTQPTWSGWPTFGQMCFDSLMVESCPSALWFDLVDVGADDPDELAHWIPAPGDWGPPEPFTHGGNWGGIAQHEDQTCRVIWEPGSTNEHRQAFFRLDHGSVASRKDLVMSVMEGITIDAFAVYFGAMEDPNLLYIYDGLQYEQEIWVSHTIGYYATGDQTITLYATPTEDDPWWGFDTYGKIPVRHIWAADVRYAADAPLFVMDNPDWVELNGTFIQEGSTTGDSPILTFNQGYGDWSFAADSEPDDPLGSIGFIFDYLDSSNYATAMLTEDGGTVLRIRRQTTGVWSDIGAAAVTVGGYPVRMQLWKRDDVVTLAAGDASLAVASSTDGLLGLLTTDMRGTFSDIFFLPAAPGTPWWSQGEMTAIPAPEGAIHLLCGRMSPNPFRRTSSVEFDLIGSGTVRLQVYDVAGRLIRSLTTGTMQGGRDRITWDGRNAAGRRVAQGVYLYRIDIAGRGERNGKVVLLDDTPHAAH